MKPEIIGPHPFDRDAEGRQRARIGTLFLDPPAVCTELPGVHALQRVRFAEVLNGRRAQAGQPPLSTEQEQHLFEQSVDLFFEPDQIVIRPNPDRMDLAFAADDLLQTLVSKRQIVFLSVADARVREAIKRRGECWRLSAIPKEREAKRALVFGSRVAIHGRPIYFYNRLTGTRWLTCQDFEELGALEPAALAQHLQEIADHTIQRNRLGRPEVDFFGADLRRIGPRPFAGIVFAALPVEELRARFEELKALFASAVHEAFHKNDCYCQAWCDRMLATLFLEGNETQSEQILAGLSPEFFLQIEWLPGGRFEEGEFLLDRIFDEADSVRTTETCNGCSTRAPRASSSISSANTATSNTSTSVACPNPCRWSGPRRGAGAACISSSSSPAAGASRSSGSSVSRSGACGSTWMRGWSCSRPSRTARNTPSTAWIGDWAAASSA